jgi:hypothetical protein
VKEVFTGDVGEKRLETGNSPLPRPGVPFGGDIFSIFWKVPLYRDDCRPLIVAPAIPLAMEPCRADALSTVLRRDPMAPGGESCTMSTISVASLVAFRFPFKRSRASFAPSNVWKWATAAAKPLSSLNLDWGTISQSTRSFAKSRMLRTASRSLLLGSLRRKMVCRPFASGLVSASLKEENMERPFFSTGLRSPNGPDMPYVCGEKTSAAMECCDEKGLGGEDEVELLMEPCMNGLLERFEGLVLLGLGPPAISSFVVTVLRWPCWEQRAAVEARRGEAKAKAARQTERAVAENVRIQSEYGGSGRRGRLPGCKTASKRGCAQDNF